MVDVGAEKDQAGQHRAAIAQQQGPGGHGTDRRSQAHLHVAGDTAGTAGLTPEQHQGFGHQNDRHQGNGIADPGGMAGTAGRRWDVDHRGEGEADRGDGLGGDGHRTKAAVERGRAGGRCSLGRSGHVGGSSDPSLTAGTTGDRGPLTQP